MLFSVLDVMWAEGREIRRLWSLFASEINAVALALGSVQSSHRWLSEGSLVPRLLAPAGWRTLETRARLNSPMALGGDGYSAPPAVCGMSAKPPSCECASRMGRKLWLHYAAR